MPAFHHRLTVVHRGPVRNPAPTDPAWHVALDWDFDDGLAFVRLRDPAGRATACTLLVRLEVEAE